MVEIDMLMDVEEEMERDSLDEKQQAEALIFRAKIQVGLEKKGISVNKSIS